MTRTVTVTPAAQARAQLGGINPADAQLERAEYELHRALRRGKDTFSLDLPLTPDAQAHPEAQGDVLKVKHGRSPAHLQIRIPSTRTQRPSKKIAAINVRTSTTLHLHTPVDDL